jgi:2-phospho-L-lactate/phosphoenolpyruvate guanylyltransferase
VIVAAIPVKDLGAAKQRLAQVLTAPERAALARVMLADVLAAVIGARVDRVWVVTRDPDAAALAHDAGVEILAEDQNRGHTAAVAFAQTRASDLGADAFLTVPGDVPCVTMAEVETLARAAASPSAVFAPSRSGLGTNGVALAPPAIMALRFGEPSFAKHLGEARRLGLDPRVLTLPALGLDVDTPEDLAAVLREGRHTSTGRLLAEWRISERLGPGVTAGR